MEFNFGFFSDPIAPSGQRKEKLEPMGPSHPSWGLALQEVESLLQQSGRVYDQGTIESIATDHNAWNELIEDAVKNMEIEGQRIRSQMLIETLGKIRNDAESEIRIEKLFGRNTKIA